MLAHQLENPYYPITVFAEGGPNWVESTIRRVEVAGGAFDIPAERVADIVPGGLPNDSLQTLVLSSLGFTNKKIGEQVQYSPRAIQSRRVRVEGKLGAAHAAQATALSFERGLYVVETPLPPHHLSYRELNVLNTAAGGQQKKEAAQTLGISVNTLKTANARVRKKAHNAPNTAAAVLLAHLSGELPLLQ